MDAIKAALAHDAFWARIEPAHCAIWTRLTAIASEGNDGRARRARKLAEHVIARIARSDPTGALMVFAEILRKRKAPGGDLRGPESMACAIGFCHAQNAGVSPFELSAALADSSWAAEPASGRRCVRVSGFGLALMAHARGGLEDWVLRSILVQNGQVARSPLMAFEFEGSGGALESQSALVAIAERARRSPKGFEGDRRTLFERLIAAHASGTAECRQALGDALMTLLRGMTSDSPPSTTKIVLRLMGADPIVDPLELRRVLCTPLVSAQPKTPTSSPSRSPARGSDATSAAASKPDGEPPAGELGTSIGELLFARLASRSAKDMEDATIHGAVRMLIAHGIDADSKLSPHQTPVVLIASAATWSTALLRALIVHGADIGVRDRKGRDIDTYATPAARSLINAVRVRNALRERLGAATESAESADPTASTSGPRA